jgi:ribonucleoside-diphosphate reductase alpha chain
MRVFDTASDIVSQGGARRGANMAVLRVDHPDVMEFIGCKTRENAITNFNISVGVTDAFMQAVEDDAPIDLVNPQDGGVWSTARARDVFEAIVSGAHRNGEPGVLYLDAANRHNPCPHLGEYEATNPCGEQYLLPYENCCLGSVNLARHIDYDYVGRPVLDWDRLRQTVELSTRFLDDVVSANTYVPAVPGIIEAAHRCRRIGLGIMGLGDVFFLLRVRYGSEEAQELGAQIAEFVRYHAMRVSIDLARTRGPFPAISGSLYDPERLRRGASRTAQALHPLGAVAPAATRLGYYRQRDKAIRDPQCRSDDGGADGHDCDCGQLRGLWVRACVCPGLRPPRERRRPRSGTAICEPAVRARA